MSVQEYSCQVKSHRMITPTVFELVFETQGEFKFNAGQFISIIIPGAGPKGRDLRRAYSIASSPENKSVELCVKKVEGGPGTTYLHGLAVGSQFRGFAPYGDFTYEPKPGRHAVFIATGTGIAPFRSMVISELYKKNPPKTATLLLGVRTEDEVLYDAELAQVPGLKWVPMVSRPNGKWAGTQGRVTDYLRSLGADFPWLETDYYLCGNGDMIKEVKAILAERAVDKESIYMEKYY